MLNEALFWIVGVTNIKCFMSEWVNKGINKSTLLMNGRTWRRFCRRSQYTPVVPFYNFYITSCYFSTFNLFSPKVCFVYSWFSGIIDCIPVFVSDWKDTKRQFSGNAYNTFCKVGSALVWPSTSKVDSAMYWKSHS